MAIWKATLSFVLGKYGWTETWHTKADTAGPALARLQRLATKRIALLGSGAACWSLSVYNVAEWRVGLVGAATGQTMAEQAGNALLGLLVRITAHAAGQSYPYRRQWLLRGAPVSVQAAAASGPGALPTDFATRLQAFVTELCSGDWMLGCQDRSPPTYEVAGVDNTVVVDADCSGEPLPDAEIPVGSSYVAVALVGGVDLSDRVLAPDRADTVLVRGVRWSVRLALKRGQVNGRQHPAFCSPGLVAFPGSLPEKGQYAGGGVLQARTVIYPTISQAEFSRVSQRKCGPAPLGRAMAGLVSGIAADPNLPLPPPPPPPPPAPVEPVGPVVFTVRNARDLVSLVYLGYNQPPIGPKLPIGIFQVQNHPGYWLVTMSGTDLTVNQATGISEDITAALGKPNLYDVAIRAAVLATVPPTDAVILAGDSLGGMQAQWAAYHLLLKGRSVSKVITYGSPLVCIKVARLEYQRFAMAGDVVPSVPPLGILLNAIGHPEQTFVDPGSIPDNFVDRHTKYDICPGLDGYDAIGNLIGSGTVVELELGERIGFPVPS